MLVRASRTLAIPLTSAMTTGFPAALGAIDAAIVAARVAKQGYKYAASMQLDTTPTSVTPTPTPSPTPLRSYHYLDSE